MIIRIWHGWTTHGNADAYRHLLDHHILPGIIERAIPGLHGVDALRRDLEDEVEFVTIMNFEDWDAVREFAGGDGTPSVVPDEARALLERFDDHSAHYDLAVRHLAPYEVAVRGATPAPEAHGEEE